MSSSHKHGYNFSFVHFMYKQYVTCYVKLSQMLTIFQGLSYMHGWKEHTNSCSLVNVLALGCIALRSYMYFRLKLANTSFFLKNVLQVKWCFKLSFRAKGYKLDISTYDQKIVVFIVLLPTSKCSKGLFCPH